MSALAVGMLATQCRSAPTGARFDSRGDLLLTHAARRASSEVARTFQAGGGLVELMTSMAVSLGIALCALYLVALSSREFARTEQDALLHDQAAYVFDVLATALQQAGHVDATQPTPQVAARLGQGALDGLDDAAVPATSAGFQGARPGSSSDALSVRFAGDALGRMRNCAGMPVPAAENASDDRGWSVFHVATDRQGEPELRCKYRGSSGWVSQAVAGGVTSFQLLYGLDPDGDGLPNDFVSASRLRALGMASGGAALSLWTRVVAVHVALLMRSPQVVRSPALQKAVDLFGSEYAARHAVDDPGTTLAPQQLHPDRLYRQFDAVIFLGNSQRPPE